MADGDFLARFLLLELFLFWQWRWCVYVCLGAEIRRTFLVCFFPYFPSSLFCEFGINLRPEAH